MNIATLKYRKPDGTYATIPIVQGPAGPAGTGIASIQQTTTNNISGGSNIWTITLTDGTTSNLTVKNGDRGAVGPSGGIQDVTASSNEGFITVTNADGTTKEVAVGAAGDFLPLSGGTLSGSIIISHNTNEIMDETTTNPRIVFSENGEQPVALVYTNYSSYRAPHGLKVIGLDGEDSWFEASKVYGAIWNDYAEYRPQEEKLIPGYIAYSDDNGKLKYTTERLQKFEGVVSDTYGFAIGETEECKTPLAVSGRVLVYTDPTGDFHSGDCVCAGPGGLAYKMTRNEVMMYPDRIVGVVSEIPKYKIWGTGKVKVDGRIWIKVR